ncbi:MAG TPA: GyrI-like domain-containing protein [Terrimicrobium sp.]
MIEKPHLAETTARLTAIIHFTIPREEMPQVFGPAVGELMAGLAAQGLAPVGPVFAHHLKMSPGIFDFELGVPVGAPMAATGRTQPGQWPALKVARTVHHGPYEGLPGAWGEFMDWIEANGHAPAEDLWECYVVHPDSSSDPASWRTELIRPLAK